MRADEAGGSETLAELNRLRLQIDALQEQLRRVSTEPPKGADRLQHGDDVIDLPYHFRAYSDRMLEKAKKENYRLSVFDMSGFKQQIPMTWDAVFAVVAPLLLQEASEESMKNAVEQKIPEVLGPESFYRQHLGEQPHISADGFQTIKVQLLALGLIQRSVRKRAVSDAGTYWTLTPYGEGQMMRLRALHRASPTRSESSADAEPKQASAVAEN